MVLQYIRNRHKWSKLDCNIGLILLLYSNLCYGRFVVHLIEADASGNKTLYTPLLVDYYNSLRNNILFEIILCVGSVHRISGMKADSMYGYMYDTSYDSSIPIVYSKVLNSGIWSDWVNVSQ